jgi:hypothetical protein
MKLIDNSQDLEKILGTSFSVFLAYEILGTVPNF